MTSDAETGLAWPNHDSGPTPPPEYESRPRDEDRLTRKPLAWWDRIKILLVLLGVWAALLWADLAGNPLLPVGDAFRLAMKNSFRLGILGVAGLEVVRQFHYFISEHLAGYHRFWTKKVFGGLQTRTSKTNDYNRYRVSRAMKLLFFLFILDLVLAKAFHAPVATALFTLPARLVAALPFVFQLAFGFFFVIFQFVGLFWFLSKGGVDVYFPDDVKTRFTDVWGQDNVLKKVKENMVFLEDPESIEKKGGYVPGGILLWGPPGTGKTLMAEAVAGETGKPFVFVDPGAFIQMFMGVGILKVKSLFRKLRKLALRYGGVIVFFDEADSLGNRGAVAQGGWGGGMMKPAAVDTKPTCNGMSYVSVEAASVLFRGSLSSSVPETRGRVVDRIIAGMGGMGGGGMGTLQALLSEMSGLKKPRGFFNRVLRRAIGLRPKPPPKYRILHMFATNMPQALDEAMLRPGRIDRIYKVGYPSKAGRLRTYEGYLAKVPHDLTEQELDRLATITPYATGASIKDIVNEALINSIRAGRDVISWRDIIKAKQLKDLGPPEDVEYIERERHAVAVHEACHALTAYTMRRHAVIDIATIEKGGSWLGLVASIPPDDQFTHWRSEHEADIMCSLASLAGERLFFDGDSSSGVSGDLESATRLATLMEGYWGMGETVASHGVTHEVGIGGGGRPGETKGKGEKALLEGSLGFRIERKLEELLGKTEKLLKQNRANVLALAHALESNKTITGEDVDAIIEGKPGPLIDGRPYHSPEFVEMLESYHAEAMAAHKAHDSAKLDLPVPARVPVYAGIQGNGEFGGRELPPAPAPEGGLNGEVKGNGGSPPRPDLH